MTWPVVFRETGKSHKFDGKKNKSRDAAVMGAGTESSSAGVERVEFFFFGRKNHQVKKNVGRGVGVREVLN